MAQVWSLPALSETTSSMLTCTGTVLDTVVPSPSWPWWLYPQQSTSPSVSRAQVWSPPADTWATSWVRPTTAVGFSLLE
jgi:hypothetical protein